MNTIFKKYIGTRCLSIAILWIAAICATTSCSDEMMERTNTDNTKVSELDPNAQLTTALLQTYGDLC